MKRVTRVTPSMNYTYAKWLAYLPQVDLFKLLGRSLRLRSTLCWWTKKTASASCRLEFETIWMQKSRHEFVDEWTLEKKFAENLWRFLLSLENNIFVEFIDTSHEYSEHFELVLTSMSEPRLIYLLSSVSSMVAIHTGSFGLKRPILFVAICSCESWVAQEQFC